MERLYDVARDGVYDLVILDTPPMRAALEILDAPRRLLDFFDSGVVRWFLAPPRGRLSQLLPRGSSAVARLLSLLGSRRLVAEARHFFGVLAPFEPSLRQRAEGVERLLRRSDTSFLLVCAPRATSLADATSLQDGLVARGIGLHAVVFNRAYVPEVGRPAVPVAVVGSEAGGSSQKAQQAEPLLKVLAELRAQVAAKNRLSRQAAAAFCSTLAPACSVSMVPELQQGVRDLTGLRELADLIAPTKLDVSD
jgi:anion-transporting  ArsA/GET3 family ATPase